MGLAPSAFDGGPHLDGGQHFAENVGLQSIPQGGRFHEVLPSSSRPVAGMLPASDKAGTNGYERA